MRFGLEGVRSGGWTRACDVGGKVAILSAADIAKSLLLCAGCGGDIFFS